MRKMGFLKMVVAMSIVVGCSLVLPATIASADAKQDASIVPTVKNFHYQAGDGQIYLGWDKLKNATKYIVYLGLDKGNYSSQINVGLNTQHTDTGLTNGANYYYAVAAMLADGTMTPQAELKATPQIGGTINLRPAVTLRTILDPQPGIYTRPINLEMRASEDNAIIYYTLDGTDPSDENNINAQVYVGDPIKISDDTVLRYYSVSLVTGDQETVRDAEYSFTAPPNDAEIVHNSQGLGELTLDTNKAVLKGDSKDRTILETSLSKDEKPWAYQDISFALSQGDGTFDTLGAGHGSTVRTNSDGEAKIAYISSYFAGTNIISAEVVTDPKTNAKIAIATTPGKPSKLAVTSRELIVGQDDYVKVAVYDEHNNLVTNNLQVNLTIEFVSSQDEDVSAGTILALTGRTKNGVAKIMVPHEKLVEGRYALQATAVGIKSEKIELPANLGSSLIETGTPTVVLLMIVALSFVFALPTVVFSYARK